MRHLMGRLRIGLGHRIEHVAVVTILVFMFAISCPDLFAGQPVLIGGSWYDPPPTRMTVAATGDYSLAETPPKMLVTASGSNWSSIEFAGGGSAPCSVSPCPGPGSSAVTRNDNVPAGFVLRALLPGETGFTFLRFNDGTTRSSFAVPPLGALIANQPQTFGPVVSDGTFTATVNVLPTAGARLSIEVLHPGGVVDVSTVDVAPPVAQIQILSMFRVASLRITNVHTVGAPGYSPPPVYGFVAWGDGAGSTYVIPFE